MLIRPFALFGFAIFGLVLFLAHPLLARQVDQELVSGLQKAQSAIGNSDFAGAQTQLEELAKEFSDKPRVWYLLGYSRHAQKDYESAMEAYEKANSLAGGKAPNALYNMACIHSIQGEKDKAFASLDAAVSAGFNNFSQLQDDADFQNVKDDPRFEKYKPVWLADDQIFVEPTRIIHQWIGENAGDEFGWTGRRVGDVDKDGVEDFISTAPSFNQGAGKVYVYSSKSGDLVHQVEGKSGYRLGNSAVGIGDVNGDDVPDFVAGAPNANGTGAVFVYSGKDASVIHALNGETKAAQFGYEVSELGDIDGDDVPDFLIGEMAGTGDAVKSGRAIVYSGKTAKSIFELNGERNGDGFGNAAAAINTGQGEFLLAIGAQNAGTNNRGRVYVYEVKDSEPKLKFTIEGDSNSVNLGQMFIAFPGDLDQDGTPDVYASDFSDNTLVAGGGKVVVHSGADGSELLAIHGSNAGEGLGTSPSDAGDVDGDGIGDLVIGAWQNREGAGSAGKVYLYSAAGSGKLLRSWTCKQAGDTLGFDACGIGDVDGDGHVDFLLTSAWSNKLGPKTGRVFIVAGEDFSTRTSETSPAKFRAGEVSTVLDEIPGGTGGLNIDKKGVLYTADFGSRLGAGGTGGNRIFKVTDDGESELFFENLRGGSGNTFDSSGNLFQSSIGGNFISKIAPDGTSELFCNSGLMNPVGLAFDSSGDLFACNCGSNSIQKITPDGKSSSFCKSSLLKCPNGITVGPDDMIYVCNFSNGDVVHIDRNGSANKLATLPGVNNGHLVYHRGYLYVLARKDCRVYQIDLAGRVSVFAGSGQRGKSDGQPMESSFSLPNSLIVSPDEKFLYVNETSPTSGDHQILAPTRIRRIELLD